MNRISLVFVITFAIGIGCSIIAFARCGDDGPSGGPTVTREVLTELPNPPRDVNCPGGYWEVVYECAPEAWDNLYVTSVEDGNLLIEVDWCIPDCSINCLGACPDTFGAPKIVDSCNPAESVRISLWRCP